MIRTSDETKHISAALLEAQQNMAPVTKDSANPHFRSKYASLSAVMDVAKPALNEAGIALLQAASPIQDNQISVTTRIVHADSCEWIEAEISIPVEQPTAQKVESALSYGKRYSLTSLLGLAEADDDGQAASHRTERPKLARRCYERARRVIRDSDDPATYRLVRLNLMHKRPIDTLDRPHQPPPKDSRQMSLPLQPI